MAAKKRGWRAVIRLSNTQLHLKNTHVREWPGCTSLHREACSAPKIAQSQNWSRERSWYGASVCYQTFERNNAHRRSTANSPSRKPFLKRLDRVFMYLMRPEPVVLRPMAFWPHWSASHKATPKTSHINAWPRCRLGTRVQLCVCCKRTGRD